MKIQIAGLLAIAGLASAASGVVNTRVAFQVSTDGTNWASTVDAKIGSTVYARTLVSYTGTASPLGLASMVFQPTVSNWTGGDTLLPFIAGGAGNNNSTPLGVLAGSQLTDTTSFGRVSPWGRSLITATAAMTGHVHTNPDGSGQTYLRLAQRQVTSWIGGTGNTSGGSGIPLAQLAELGRTTQDPAFNSSTSNIFVFKFAFTLGTSAERTMVIDAPAAGFGNRSSTTGERQVYWFLTMTEPTGQERGAAVVDTASVNVVVPAPASVLALGAAAFIRRRRPRA